MNRNYALLFVVVFSLPVFLGINAWQSNEAGRIRHELRQLEREQQNLIEEGRELAAEIADLLSIDRLEREAWERFRMRRLSAEELTLVIIGRGNAR
ncbi:MAG: hypothetical protein FWD94_00455 [Treponema sp.]|nr:hypothetical protein [Treponema sp.]